MLRFQGHFSTEDIEKLTWFEAEKYVEFFARQEEIKHVSMVVRIVECLCVTKGKSDEIRRYVNRLTSKFSDDKQENDLEDQFKGVNFG